VVTAGTRGNDAGIRHAPRRLWRRLGRMWCLSRGWTCVPPPAAAPRPLYAPGTQARIDRLRTLHAVNGSARPHAGPATPIRLPSGSVK
jgi:hypothetical protein